MHVCDGSGFLNVSEHFSLVYKFQRLALNLGRWGCFLWVAPLADVWSHKVEDGLLSYKSEFCRHSSLAMGLRTLCPSPKAKGPAELCGQCGVQSSCLKGQGAGHLCSHGLTGSLRCLQWVRLVSVSLTEQKLPGVMEKTEMGSILCWEVSTLSSHFWKTVKSDCICCASCRKRNYAWYWTYYLWWGFFGFWKEMCCDTVMRGILRIWFL